MQSPDSNSHDRTTSNVAEPGPGPGAPERSVLHVASPASSEEAGATLEGRSPIAHLSERLAVEATLKGPAPKRSGRIARFARATLKTIATLLILVLAALAALVIWNYYVTAPWTRDGSVRAQVARIAP